MRYTFTVFAVCTALLTMSGQLDKAGEAYTEQALTRALVTFGIARALNGVISVAQGTEVALQPAGVGLTFTPGEILDPVNDLVERFSLVMLFSSAALGVLKTLLAISAWPWLTGLTVFMLGTAVVVLWLPRLQAWIPAPLAVRLASLLIVLRLAVPVVSIANEQIYEIFLAPQYSEATQQLRTTTEDLHKINESTRYRPDPGRDTSVWSSARELYRNAADAIDIEARLARYEQAATDAAKYLVDLIVVFVFQTVLLPVGLVWLLWQVVSRLLRT